MKISVKIPPVELISSRELAQAIENTLNNTAKAVKTDFLVTVDTWKGKPDFTIQRGNDYRYVYTTSKEYFFVNAGTKVRRAVMSDDFRPKSRPEYIGSNIGRGGVVFISKKINLPGIKARKFDKTIQEKWQKQFPITLQRAIDAAVSK